MEPREVEEEAVLAALMGISEMMVNLGDIEELLDAIVRIAPPLASVGRCAIFLRDPRTRAFRVTHAFSADPETTAQLSRLAIAEDDVPKLVHRIVAQKIPVMLREGRDPVLPPSVVDAFQVRSMLLVPLVHQDEVLGFIALDEPGRDHVFTSREVNVVNAIAAHAAIALVQARLRDALTDEARRAAVLADALCDGVCTVDEAGRIVSMSPGAEKLLARRASEVIGRPLADLFGQDGEVDELVRRVLAGDSPESALVDLSARGKTPVTVRVVAAAVSAGGGRNVLCALDLVDAIVPD